MTRVGHKGQMVIQKELRDRLGVGPGWHTIQEVRDGALVVRFEPPLHTRSLAGIFSEYARGIAPPTEEEIDEISAQASADHWADKEAAGDFGS